MIENLHTERTNTVPVLIKAFPELIVIKKNRCYFDTKIAKKRFVASLTIRGQETFRIVTSN